MKWRVKDKDGAPVGVVHGASRDEALGRAQIKYGLSRHPYTAEEVPDAEP